MERKDFPKIGEQMYCETLENGLRVFVIPKPEFQKSYAFFATNFGGMNVRFEYKGKWHETPAGVAHYLEHKMFDTKEGNALQDLAANGASPNAFTSNAITGYYFESTEKFEENLRILLSFVSVPWFTQESVDKERGIIGQEIGMIEDNPDWKAFNNLMKAMYEFHPIRISVAGSVESIAEITPETLYACHKAFYDPSNMALCVAGNVDPEEICKAAREILPKTPGSIANRDYGKEEPRTVYKPLIEQQMAVATPIFHLGFKGIAAPNGMENLRQELLGDLACEALFGTSTPLYAELYKKGLVNNNYGYGYECYPGCAFLCVGGESRDPKAVRDAILAEAVRITGEGIEPALWERLKKASYGGHVRGMNSFENICVGQAQAAFAGYDYFDCAECYSTIQKSDAEAMISDWVRDELTALSIVTPREEIQA